MLALVVQLKGTFHTRIFLWNLLSSYSSEFLLMPGSERLYSKLLSQILGKHLRIRRPLRVLCRLGFQKKIENVQEKNQCRSPASVSLPCDFIKTGLHYWYFQRNVATFFAICICLVSQIIITLIGLHKDRCLSVITEVRYVTAVRTMVKSHKGNRILCQKMFW